MHKRISAVLLTIAFFAPALALAQVTTGSSTVDSEVQSLLSQITSLQAQLKTLLQSVAPASPAWSASSTLPSMGQGGLGMGNCGGFGRDLSEGSRGSDVSQLQQVLSDDGFLSASSTGFFGPMTARALAAFQVHFGIAASSSASGFFGSLTRNFLSVHCGDRGNDTGSSTPRMMNPMIPANGTSTPWGNPESFDMTGSSTLIWHGPNMMYGSSTEPHMPPCQNNDNQGAAASLFIPHAILPMNPCHGAQGTSSDSNSQQQDH